jgi:hypothetical protein
MDLNRTAFRIVNALSEENTKDPRSQSASVAGKSGGPARAASLSPERRKEIAVKANRARWKRDNAGQSR